MRFASCMQFASLTATISKYFLGDLSGMFTDM